MLKTQVSLLQVLICFVAIGASVQASNLRSKPSRLTCESLTTPLGMDERRPALSWQLQDSRRGAAQNAYEIQVATSPALLRSDKTDIWDSGRIQSSQSVDVRYGGPALAAFQRYYWRVKVWDENGRPYSPSDITWWETGLLDSSRWQAAEWISYEDDEHRSVRSANAQWITTAASASVPPSRSHDAHFYFRFKFDVPAAVRIAKLHITGEDTVAAWVNGTQEAQPQPWPA